MFHTLRITLQTHMREKARGNAMFTEIVNKFDEILPKLSVEVHKAAYCVDPDF